MVERSLRLGESLDDIADWARQYEQMHAERAAVLARKVAAQEEELSLWLSTSPSTCPFASTKSCGCTTDVPSAEESITACTPVDAASSAHGVKTDRYVRFVP